LKEEGKVGGKYNFCGVTYKDSHFSFSCFDAKSSTNSYSNPQFLSEPVQALDVFHGLSYTSEAV
jgi:hypothetical protein